MIHLDVAMLELGTLIYERYRVIRAIGRGGFGQTFEVLDEVCAATTDSDRRCQKVMKVLDLRGFYDPEIRQKSIDLFRREARVLSQLQHSGIPRVNSDGYFRWPEDSDDPFYCLVMEKISGPTLRIWLKRRQNHPISEKQGIAWLFQLARILDQIHQRDLIHRDIKPPNIILRPDGQLVLIDFGAVREITATYLLNDRTDGMTGTRIFAAGYTPHEQAEGRAVPQSDFFALGRTMVHLLTAKHPVDFQIDNRTGRLNWREAAPHVSAPLANLLDDLMEPFPGNRPQSAQIILQRLASLIYVDNSTPGRIWSSSALVSSPEKPDLPPLPIQAWQNVRLLRTLSDHRDQVRAIALTPDSQLLVSGSYDSTIKLWSMPRGILQSTLTEHSNRVTAVAVSPDGQLLATGSFDRTIKLWAMPSGQLLRTLPRQPEPVQALAFSTNSQVLVSASGTAINLWAARTGTLLRPLSATAKAVRSLAFSPNGRILAVGSLDGTVELWNPIKYQRQESLTYQFGSITAVEFSPIGVQLAIAGGTSIELWDLRRGKQVPLTSHQAGPIAAICFSPDGQILASASGRVVELWNIQRRRRLCPPLSSHTRPIRSVAFSPNGRVLVSASSDKTIKVWQPAS
ncbi:MAG: protein kinase domain-containing protein [Elainellaceae cyanobacterium]